MIVKNVSKMIVCAVCAVVMILCAACGGLKTYTLSELIPPVLDDATLLPVLASVTVTRVSDGAAVTLEGREVETLMLCFDNVVCTQEKKTGAAGAYVVSFERTDEVQAPSMVIDGVKDGYATAFEIGGYRYVTVNMTADLTYLLSLFD